jgi:outer membrane protein W
VFVMMVAVLVVSPVARAQEPGWSLRLNATWTDPNETSVDDSLPEAWIETSTGETFGLALSTEYRFSERLGLELGAQAGYQVKVDYDAREKLSGGIIGDPLDPHPSDDMRFTVVDVALNIYLFSGGVDFYIGPVLGLIAYQDTVVRTGSEETPVTISNDGDVAYGAVVGLDIPFTDSPWFVTSSLKYLVSSYDASIPALGTSGPIDTEIDFDPWIWRLGLGYKF